MPLETESIRFGRFTLDFRRRELLACAGPVPLDGKAFDVLACLIAQRDRAVSRDEILAQVWPNRIVAPSNVPVQISAIRRALTDAGELTDPILTIGATYRFIGDIETVPPGSKAPEHAAGGQAEPFLLDPPARVETPGRSMALWAGSVALLLFVVVAASLPRWLSSGPVPPRLSIVVLPFRYLGADSSQAHLADAITEDLTTELAHVPSSLVIARESAASFQGKSVTMQEIGRQLQVRYAVEGSLRVAGTRYEIIARLIDTATGGQLWGQPFAVSDDRMSDALDAVVRQIATTLDFQIAQIMRSRSLHDRPDNPDALDLFFRARASLDGDASPGGMAKAQSMLRAAITQQPDFVDALAALGASLVQEMQAYEDPNRDADRVEADNVIRHALSLSPRNATALAARARELSLDGRCPDAETVAGETLAVEPSNLDAEAVLAGCAWKQGNIDAASAHLDAIGRINPDGLGSRRRYITQAIIALLKKHPNDAAGFLRRVSDGDEEPQPGGGAMGPAELVQLLWIATDVISGDLRSAIARYETYGATWQNRSVWRLTGYFPKAVASLHEAAPIFFAWRKVGLPQFVDERNIPVPDSSECSESGNLPTPWAPPDGFHVDTSDLAKIPDPRSQPLVVDLGWGAASIPGAVWKDPWGLLISNDDFLRVAVDQHAAKREQKIVVLGDGPFDCAAYSAALRLSERLKRPIGWYRGGEEAWAASGNQSIDFRRE